MLRWTKTVMALPLGLGEDRAETVIASRGVFHKITLTVNRLAGRVDVERRQEPVDVVTGTRIGIRWPHGLGIDEVEEVLGEIAAFNPHATISNGERRWPRLGPIRKWAPSDPTPAHWYTPVRFVHRIMAELRRDPEITIQQFLGTFKGLTDRSRRARVAEAVDLSAKPLAALLDATGMDVDAKRCGRLLFAMQDASTAPKIETALGGLGKNHVRAVLASNGDQSAEIDLPGFAYLTIAGGTIPWRWELAFAPGDGSEGPKEWVGHNFTTLVDARQLVDVIPSGLRYFHGPYKLFLHRISPARTTSDYGKSRLVLQPDETSAVHDGITKLTAKWIERQRVALARKYQTLPQREERGGGGEQRISIRDAVFRLLPEAYATASSGGTHAVRARQIYYAIRPKVLGLTGAETLSDQYFGTQLLPEYMQQHPDSTSGWRVLFDPRGTLIEPHTQRQVPVGTAGVAAYSSALLRNIPFSAGYSVARWDPDTCGPANRYSALIVAEKEGIADLLHSSGLGERYDVAILGLKGQPTEAALRLEDALGLPTFILHDFDRSGITIAANLTEGTWRHQHRNTFPVIDIGLRLEQIDGLESEPIDKKNLKSVGDDRLRECGATAAEIEFLRRRRVELNALTTSSLVEMVEAALIEHGIKKVIPSAKDLANAWRSASAAAEINLRLDEVCAEIGKRWRSAEPPPLLQLQLRNALIEDPGKAWDQALNALVYEQADDTDAGAAP
jgi:hypothetical protein